MRRIILLVLIIVGCAESPLAPALLSPNILSTEGRGDFDACVMTPVVYDYGEWVEIVLVCL